MSPLVARGVINWESRELKISCWKVCEALAWRFLLKTVFVSTISYIWLKWQTFFGDELSLLKMNEWRGRSRISAPSRRCMLNALERVTSVTVRTKKKFHPTGSWRTSWRKGRETQQDGSNMCCLQAWKSVDSGTLEESRRFSSFIQCTITCHFISYFFSISFHLIFLLTDFGYSVKLR